MSEKIYSAMKLLENAGYTELSFEDYGDDSYSIKVPYLHQAGIGEITPSLNNPQEFSVGLAYREMVKARIWGVQRYIGFCQRAPYEFTLKKGGVKKSPIVHTGIVVEEVFRKRGIADVLYRVHCVLNGESDREFIPITNPLIPFFMKRGFLPVADFFLNNPDERNVYDPDAEPNQVLDFVQGLAAGLNLSSEVDRNRIVELVKDPLAQTYYREFCRIRNLVRRRVISASS